MRARYAACVQTDWIEPSIIASGRLVRMLDSLEKLAPGRWHEGLIAARHGRFDSSAVVGSACSRPWDYGERNRSSIMALIARICGALRWPKCSGAVSAVSVL